MDWTVVHFIQLLAWLALSLVLFGIGRLSIYCFEKTVILDKWFDQDCSSSKPNTRQTLFSSSSATPSRHSFLADNTSSLSYTPPIIYNEQWHKEDVDDLGRANSFLGSLFFVLSLFYVDDIGHRFSFSGKNARFTFITLGTLMASSFIFSFGWASKIFRDRWKRFDWFRTTVQSIYLAAALFCFVYLTVGAGDDWPLFLIGLGVYFSLILVAYVCFVRRSLGDRRRFGYDFWSLSYMLCLINLQHDLVANLLYAVFFAHFMATASRYQPTRLFYPMYSSSLPVNVG